MAVQVATENSLFSVARCQPPKIMTYFRLNFSGGQAPPKIEPLPPKMVVRAVVSLL
jgi:hypothetical protein